jgi:hypothetical protein
MVSARLHRLTAEYAAACYFKKVRLHSYLSAIMGSTLVARYAGKRHARKATSTSKAATARRVRGSFELTP